MKKNKVTRKRTSSKASKKSPEFNYNYDDLENIKVHGQPRHNTKAQESYLDVTFTYNDDRSWEGSIVIKCRRAGIDIHEESEIKDYIKQVYIYCHPDNYQEWREKQKYYWETRISKSKKTYKDLDLVTKPLFDKLLNFEWNCVPCVSSGNPNTPRRYQDLKSFGYSIATHLNMPCDKCKKKRTHILLVPLPRRDELQYEIMSPTFINRCFIIFNSYDVYEGKTVNKKGLLIEHKFPEIRWNITTPRTKEILDNLTDEEIKNDFQLMTNQRNLQKREVCRKCYESNIRPYPFGIKFYYQGDEKWPDDIPKNGKNAEKGCIGCGWYDMEKWRNALNQKLSQVDENEVN